jgi:nucleotide-binding universal stress UspA family protein
MNGPVVCGIDETNGEAVAGAARGLAERYRLPLLYVRVLHEGGDADEAARLLRAAAAPGDAELAVEWGHPADRLVELAAEREAAFLVVGSRGPRSPRLGSISTDVARNAPCPVMVVPPAATAGRAGGGGSEPAVAGGVLRFGR